MRITVDIPEIQHRVLTAVAQRRGLPGISSLVQDALADYLAAADAETELLLGLEGILNEEAEHEMRARIAWIRARNALEGRGFAD